MEIKILTPDETGDLIRELREATGLSRSELGAVAFGKELRRGTAEARIMYIENGEAADTSVQKLGMLAVAFAKLRGFSEQEVFDYLMGRIDSLNLEVRRPTLRAIEGENKPDWGVPSSKSRSRRAPKKQDKAAGQVDIQCSPLRPPEQPIQFEVAA